MPETTVPPELPFMTDAQRKTFKHAMNGQIRNILANEFGFRPNQAVQPGEIHKAAIQRMSGDQNFIDKLAVAMLKRIEPKIIAAVNQQVKKTITEAFGAQIESALGDLKITVEHKPPVKNKNFGRF